MRILVRDPDYYYKAQHEIHGLSNGNDLYEGYRTKIDFTGYWDGKRHYGVFVLAHNPRTGSVVAVNIEYFDKDNVEDAFIKA